MYPKTFFEAGAAKQQSGRCFVIMPFASGFDEVYDVIKTTIEGPELSLICSRADDLQGGGHIIEDILRQIAEAEIVIADLTGRNANVFYELGIVQMVKAVDKVFLLAQDIESIPFDVRVFRTIIYKQSIQGAKELTEKLASGVKSVVDKTFRFSIGQGERYAFQTKLMGPDRCAYDFGIPDCFCAADGAKFILIVNRYVIGREPAETHREGYGLSTGQRLSIPGLDWDISLEKVDRNVASFVVRKSAM